MFPFYRMEHRYRETNATHNSPNEFRDPLGSLWNHARAGPFRLVRKTLHISRSFPALRIIVLLKCNI